MTGLCLKLSALQVDFFFCTSFSTNCTRSCITNVTILELSTQGLKLNLLDPDSQSEFNMVSRELFTARRLSGYSAGLDKEANKNNLPGGQFLMFCPKIKENI